MSARREAESRLNKSAKNGDTVFSAVDAQIGTGWAILALADAITGLHGAMTVTVKKKGK